MIGFRYGMMAVFVRTFLICAVYPNICSSQLQLQNGGIFGTNDISGTFHPFNHGYNSIDNGLNAINLAGDRLINTIDSISQRMDFNPLAQRLSFINSASPLLNGMNPIAERMNIFNTAAQQLSAVNSAAQTLNRINPLAQGFIAANTAFNSFPNNIAHQQAPINSLDVQQNQLDQHIGISAHSIHPSKQLNNGLNQDSGIFSSPSLNNGLTYTNNAIVDVQNEARQGLQFDPNLLQSQTSLNGGQITETVNNQFYNIAPEVNNLPQLNHNTPQINIDKPLLNNNLPQVNNNMLPFDENFPHLNNHLPHLTHNLPQLNNNLPLLNDNLNNNVPHLNNNLIPINNNLPHLNQNLPQLNNQLFQSSDNIPLLNNNFPPENNNLLSNNNHLPHLENNFPHINNNLPHFSNNIPHLDNNLPQVNDNLPHLNNHNPSLNHDLPQLNNHSPQLNDNNILQLDRIPHLNTNLPQVTNNFPQLNNDLLQMNNNLPQVNNNLPQLNNNLPQVTNNFPHLNINLPQVNNNFPPLNNNISGVNNGLSGLNNNFVKQSSILLNGNTLHSNFKDKLMNAYSTFKNAVTKCYWKSLGELYASLTRGGQHNSSMEPLVNGSRIPVVSLNGTSNSGLKNGVLPLSDNTTAVVLGGITNTKINSTNILNNKTAFQETADPLPSMSVTDLSGSTHNSSFNFTTASSNATKISTSTYNNASVLSSDSNVTTLFPNSIPETNVTLNNSTSTLASKVKNITDKSAILLDDGSTLRSHLKKINSSTEDLAKWDSIVKDEVSERKLNSTSWIRAEPYCSCNNFISCNCCISFNLAVINKTVCLEASENKTDSGTILTILMDNERFNVTTLINSTAIVEKVNFELEGYGKGEIELSRSGNSTELTKDRQFCTSSSLSILGLSFTGLPFGCFSHSNHSIKAY